MSVVSAVSREFSYFKFFMPDGVKREEILKIWLPNFEN